MAGTRSSARQAEKANGSSPASAKSPSNSKGSGSGGTKRKAADDTSPTSAKAKRGRPATAAKEQKTLEQTMPGAGTDGKNGDDGDGDVEMQEGAAQEQLVETKAEGNGNANGEDKAESKQTEKGEAEKGDGDIKNDEAKASDNTEKAHEDSGAGASKKDDEAKAEFNGQSGNALDQVKADVNDDGKTHQEDKKDAKDDAAPDHVEEKAVEEDKKREEAMPSNVLEKGVIYFFTRGRVTVDDPDSVQDLARSYFVMRPLPDGAKITDGAIQDLQNNRLVALPKKVWPKSGKDRFMAFVEKAQTSNKTLKDEFYAGSEYSTQTVGTRHTPEVTPLGEGVYTITSTGGGQGTTHLVYMLTIPQELGDVQKDVGLAAKGSFVVSLKNPKAPGPANAQLDRAPDYPDEFFEEFRGRGWMPAHPKHLDYANAQMLLIGEDFESSHNLDPAAKDEKDEKTKTPQEELERLEKEDEQRVEHLKGDDTIFADLEISSKEYSSLKTTW